MKYITTVNDQTFLIEVLDEHHVSVNGKTMEIDFESVNDQPVYSLIVNGRSFEGFVYPEDDQWQVLLRGTLYTVQVEDEREKRLKAASGRGAAPTAEFHLKAPMPGMVVTVPVQEGDTVQKGDLLVILESMKMQNELRAPRKGTVTRIRVKYGDSVEQKQTLLTME